MTSQTIAPQVAVNDIGDADEFLAAIDSTIKYFNDGDIVEGTIVKVDRDEVLLDIGYKTEGVIPSRELSIKHDVDPHEVVSVGDAVEALVLQKEDKDGRLILSKKRAQYERAWGTIERIKEEDGVVEGSVIEVVKGGLILDIGLRGFLPASLVEMRRRSRSMSMTLTKISSPTWTICSGISTWRSASSEMCTRPSMPSSTRTKAPKGTSFVTRPGATCPIWWVRAKCCQGSSCVAFSERLTRSRSMSTSSTSTVTS